MLAGTFSHSGRSYAAHVYARTTGICEYRTRTHAHPRQNWMRTTDPVAMRFSVKAPLHVIYSKILASKMDSVSNQSVQVRRKAKSFVHKTKIC